MRNARDPSVSANALIAGCGRGTLVLALEQRLLSLLEGKGLMVPGRGNGPAERRDLAKPRAQDEVGHMR